MLADPELFEQLSKAVIKALKKLMSWGDSYEIDIAYDRDIVMALAVIIAIDCVIDQSQNS